MRRDDDRVDDGRVSGAGIIRRGIMRRFVRVMNQKRNHNSAENGQKTYTAYHERLDPPFFLRDFAVVSAGIRSRASRSDNLPRSLHVLSVKDGDGVVMQLFRSRPIPCLLLQTCDDGVFQILRDFGIHIGKICPVPEHHSALAKERKFAGDNFKKSCPESPNVSRLDRIGTAREHLGSHVRQGPAGLLAAVNLSF